MIPFLVTTIVIVIIGIAVYFWQKPAPSDTENILPPQPNARGLFAEDSSASSAERERLAIAVGESAEQIIAKAKGGDRAALDEAHQSGDAGLYDQVLTEFLQRSESGAQILSLTSYVVQHELPVNNALAKAGIKSWSAAPDRSGTARALHLAALTDDADVYRETVEEALGLWREQKMADISPVELRALFDGEFWVLSSRTRSSGAGFVLKRTLKNARRELEAASAKQ
ncbi:MAG TPA: hypothetical protein VLQ90_14230 [Pyrinomonadaceae bacterium]|nr:hypothetical protein [Pyrinomonadaceae bacterium]